MEQGKENGSKLNWEKICSSATWNTETFQSQCHITTEELNTQPRGWTEKLLTAGEIGGVTRLYPGLICKTHAAGWASWRPGPALFKLTYHIWSEWETAGKCEHIRRWEKRKACRQLASKRRYGTIVKLRTLLISKRSVLLSRDTIYMQDRSIDTRV